MMRNILCCFRGESSSSQSVGPFGDNHLLNYAHRYNLVLRDDRYPQGFDPNEAPSSPPILVLPVLTFHWNEILVATNHFDILHFLGQGEFGEVYRCNFPDTDTVGAAKIQNLKPKYGHSEFVAEIKTLHRAHHPNVVRLLGKVFGPERRGVVYEYMPNGSLDRHLYAGVTRPRLSPGLDWNRRIRIALGVAEGLDYLHTGLKVLHLDVKIGNVLLDKDFVPKLTDFGLATKMVHDDNGKELPFEMSPIKGTRGCIAPETEESGSVSTKSDVYSYGIFLLQLFTGRKAFDFDRPVETRKITDWLKTAWSSEETMAMVIDFRLGGKFPVEGMKRVLQAARMCINPQVDARPEMGFLASMVRDVVEGYEVPAWSQIEYRHSICTSVVLARPEGSPINYRRSI